MRSRSHLRTLLICALIILSTSACMAKTVYVKTDGLDTNDGLSWSTAKKTVAAGITASASSDEIWVAQGTYVECITLTAGVGLYGGFAGTETSRSQRNWKTNVTVLDGSSAGSVIQLSQAGTGSKIDGFTIRNGSKWSGGGGIDCSASSPVIQNNIITMNWGAGIYCTGGSPTISHNVISANNGSSGGAVYCLNSSPTITDNTISKNEDPGIYCSVCLALIANNVITGNGSSSKGGGIYCAGSFTTTIANNTITGNSAADGGGIYCTNSLPTITNNIVAFNSSGLRNGYVPTLPVLRNNCVYGNTSYDYSGLSAGVGDISKDPDLDSETYGKVHIQPSSPCIDAGDDSVVGAGWLDMDGQVRIQGAHVDIGADESDGTNWASTGGISVRSDGDNANDGSSWALAKKTVQAALDAAAPGDEIWVAAGTYAERITLKAGVAVYGGFAGTERLRADRNWNENLSVLDGGQGGCVVTAPSGVTATAIIDGFVIQNGKSDGYGGGVYIYRSSPTIANNTIMGNSSSGIRCSYSSGLITNNRIIGNSALSGGGICCSNFSSPTIANNVIAENRSTDSSAALGGGGIYCSLSSPVITNNTVVRNTAASGNGAGIYCYYTSSPTISNNIVAFNATGIYRYSTDTSPVLQNNCVYGNTDYDYSGLTAGTGDISMDPKLAVIDWGNVHVQPGSPCIDTGLDSAVGTGWLDMDGQLRLGGSHVDIGADESDGTSWRETPAIVRVSPSGDNANDGSTWELAKRTVQSGLNMASLSGGEVWVASGTYAGCIMLKAGVALYGGFAGTETSASQRDWATNVTALDGKKAGSVIVVQAGQKVGRIDGFTIRNGSAPNGGGIHVESASPVIEHNVIAGCSASTMGGGIYCRAAGPTINANVIAGCSATIGGGIGDVAATSTITNNIIRGNSASMGGGVYSGSSSDKLINNTIIDNIGSTQGGGVHCQMSAISLRNNIIAFNQRGVYAYSTAGGMTPTFYSNCVYGNAIYAYTGLSAKPSSDIATDPLFVDKEDGNLRLMAESPCIDKGIANSAPSVDMDGLGRPQDGNVDGKVLPDIGAYEYPFTLASGKSRLADNASVALYGMAVTAVFSSGRVYVESSDRSMGIRVDTAQSLSEDQVVNVSGAIATDPATGERYIAASTGSPVATGAVMEVRPLTLTNSGLTGGGLGLQFGSWSKVWEQDENGVWQLVWRECMGANNIGLLVTTFGRVAYAGDGFFYVNDGSVFDDGSGSPGVKVLATGLTFPSSGFVKVTGISSCEKNAEGKIIRLLRVRKQGDIASF